MSRILENWLKRFSIAKVQVHKNLAFIPITSANGSDLELLTLNKAMKDKSVAIKELEAGASVPEISVINKSDKYVLIVDGEHLIGAKQNRIVNKTIIVPPKSELVIPVSCTEQGRWQYNSGHFRSSKYWAPSSVRSTLKENFYAQNEVWNKITERLNSFRVSSPTSSLEDAYFKLDSYMDEYKNSISKVPTQVGFMVFINGEFAGLDVIGDTKLFSEMYDKTISGYLLDALYNIDNKSDKNITNNSYSKIVNELLTSKTQTSDSIGAEKRKSIQGKKVVGEFITFKRNPVHLSIFPKTNSKNYDLKRRVEEQ